MTLTSTFERTPIDAVQAYWDRRPCNIRHSPAPLGSRQYFDESRDRKYFVEPHIPRFANFAQWNGKRVLEIGCGLGADTISFAQAGANVVAVDLSPRSLELAQRRASIYSVSDTIRFLRADVERLPEQLPIEPFDLVYSFGALHHTPHPGRALTHLRRYLKPSGELRIMLYHRRSWKTLRILATTSRGRLWRINELIARQSEAQTGCPVTYSYSRRSASRLLENTGFHVQNAFVDHIFPYRIPDYKQHRYVKALPWRCLPAPLFRALERRLGWHLCLTATPR